MGKEPLISVIKLSNSIQIDLIKIKLNLIAPYLKRSKLSLLKKSQLQEDKD